MDKGKAETVFRRFLDFHHLPHFLFIVSELGIVLTLAIIMGGIVFHLRDQRAGVACSQRPTLRALQVSCLATQALGVQFYGRDGGLALDRLFALACIIIGVAGLGMLSLFCDCRDAALRG